MYEKLIIEGNAVYEIDEECLKQRQGRKRTGTKGRNGYPRPSVPPEKP